MIEPYYSDGGVTIYCADNCAVLCATPPESVDLVVTSPPYDDLRTYGGHSWDFYGVAWLLKRALKPGGVIVWVVADQTKDGSETGTSMEQALHFKRLGLNLHDTMVYQVAGTGAKGSNLAYWQEWEYTFVFSKGTPKSVYRLERPTRVEGRRKRTSAHMAALGTRQGDYATGQTCVRGNVWTYHAGKNVDYSVAAFDGHPAPFPYELALDHILSWSDAGDTVLDPFAGSGTALEAAKEAGRHAVGIEVEEEYCRAAVERLRQSVLPLTG